MAKIDRKLQKVFGSALPANNHIAEFGSLKAGSVAYSLDPDDIQNTAFENGWEDALQANKAPPLQDLNALFYLLSRQIAYTMQAGVPEYSATTEYHIGSVVNDGTGVRYISKTNTNTGNALTSLTYWDRESTGLPLGSVVATFPNLTGAYACVATTVADAKGFVVCGGQTIADATSPMNGQVVPNINNDVFLMGNATSGTAGGANALNLQHTHSLSVSGSTTLPDHTHNLDGTGGARMYMDYTNGNVWSASDGGTGPSYTTTTWFLRAMGAAQTFSGTRNLVALSGKTSTVTATIPTLGFTSTGTSGASLSTTQDIRPKYITARWVMRVK